jgi:hypothetical protein
MCLSFRKCVSRSGQGSVKAVANATFILALTGSWLDLSWRLGKERNNLIFSGAKQYFFNHASISSQSLGLLQLYFHFEEKGDVIFA